MPDRTTAARGRRSEARERRRSRVSEPFEELDQAARSADSRTADGSNGTFPSAAANLVGTAVAAGLLGALGGATKALLERRHADGEPAGPDAEEAPPADEEETARAEAPGPEPATDEQEPRADETAEEQDEEETLSEAQGVSDGDAAEIVGKARSQLERLLGSGVERVSGLDSSSGRWSVTLEVVEVARVPESTDVMATYEVVLDEESNLVSVRRVRRYRRSQVDGQQ